MTKKKARVEKHDAYLAYWLGCLPFMLHDNVYLEFSDNWPPYDWAVHQGIEAIERLRTRIGDQGDQQADAANRALTARWESLKSPQRQRPHLDTLGQGPPRVDPGDIFCGVVYVDSEWGSFAEPMRAFVQALPQAYREFAALGTSIGEIRTGTMLLKQLNQPSPSKEVARASAELLATALIAALTHLQTLICTMSEKYELLVGLDIDFSQGAYQASKEKGPHRRSGQAHQLPQHQEEQLLGDQGVIGAGVPQAIVEPSPAHSGDFVLYRRWVKNQVKWLHLAIVQRLGPSRKSQTSIPTWISGTEAVDLAVGFQVQMSIATLSKHARKLPAPFQSQSFGHNRLSIELSSFVSYLWKKKQQKLGAAADEVDDVSEINKRIEAEREKKRGGRHEPPNSPG